MMGPKRVIVIMAKAPTPGQAKTRLIPFLGAELAALLYHQMLLDTIDIAAAALDGFGDISLACPTRRDQTMLQSLVPSEIPVIADEQGSLMAGLEYSLDHHVGLAYNHVVLLDGDSPTLPEAYLQSAFNALEAADIVLGPTLDGGYYLLGACRPQPALFRWEQLESAAVCHQTQARAEALGQRVHLLPPWYDIDTAEDIARLVDGLRQEAEAAPRTRRFLADNGYMSIDPQ